MKNRDLKKAAIETIHLYKGEWKDNNFVITGSITRKDLTDPNINPAFIIKLNNKIDILAGWTRKGSHRLFYIQDYIQDYTSPPDLPGFRTLTLKIIRMRGPQWQKITKIVKRGMDRWFQGDDFNLVGKFDKFTFPLINQVYPPLYAADIVSVQPMTPPVLFFGKSKI